MAKMIEGDDGDAGANTSAGEIPRPTVFLSYAAQDRPAAKALRDALSGLGVEVWYDESELGGGEAWDQKIRRQIRECDYFMPMVSARTDARLEGYFRREWRLAVERTFDMADDRLFLLPVVIDETDQAVARVPEKFLSVQWLKVPNGRATPALEALCRRIASGGVTIVPPARKPLAPHRGGRGPTTTPDYPVFPKPDPGQRLRFSLALLGWASRSAWVGFRRLPRWIRIIAIVWLVAILSSRGCRSHRDQTGDISPATAEKLKTIAQQYQGSSNRSDVAKLGAQIAREIAKDAGDNPSQGTPLLAIPFIAPAGAAAAGKLADSAFATVYGRLAVSRHGHVALTEQPLASGELGAALERGRALHSIYVLFGTIEMSGTEQVLNIRIASVENRSVLWSKSYPVNGTDPAAIAAEVDSMVPSLDE
jgi:TolB-like protein